MAALRAPPDGWREDGQVDRQHRARQRPAGRRHLAARPPLHAHLGPLPGQPQRLRRLPGCRGAAVARLDAAVAALEAYREDRADDPDLGAALRPPGSGSAMPSTTTSTSRKDSRPSSTWSATSIAGSSGVRSRPRTRRWRSPPSVTSTACSRSCPTTTRPSNQPRWPCSTSGGPHERPATGRAPIGCATNSRPSGSPSKTPATASVGVARRS